MYETAKKIAWQSQRLTAEQLEDITAEERLQAYMNGGDPHKWLCEFWKQIHILRSKNNAESKNN